MKKFVSALCAAAMSIGAVGAGLAPSQAAPLPVQIQSNSSLVVDVNHRRGHDVKRKYNRNKQRQGKRGFERRGSSAYYNGQRGSRSHRRGYRQHNGYWFPPAAFIAGAIIGGALNSSRSNSGDHVSWCYDRYRSYRASDNTFQPYNGPRQRCNSPYR